MEGLWDSIEKMICNNEIKISIIVPVYNVAGVLKKCIVSIVKQSYHNLQIILVDDGSTDGSSDICDKYANIDKRIEVIHKSNGGLVSARKAGLKVATGEYVLNVDADDWIEPDMVETLLKIALENETDIVCSAHFLDMGNKSKKILNRLSVGKYETKDLHSVLLNNGIFYQFNITAFIWSKFFKRSILEKAQYPVEEAISFGEDVVVTFPGILYAKTIYITDYAGYHYVQRAGSITNINYSNELQKDMALVHYLTRVFSEHEDADILLNQLSQYAKLLLLLRQLDWFDRKQTDCILTPFGGIPKNSRVVIYAAGKLGQNIYQYLSNIKSIQIVDWLDQSYDMYQEIGYPVHDPEKFCFESEKYDAILVAISEQPLMETVRQYLKAQGATGDKIYCLTSEFLEGKSDLNYQAVAICGFRKSGRALYEKYKQKGIYVPYIIERNYQALSEIEQLPVPIVGFDADIYDQADAIVMTPDLPKDIVLECMEIAGIKVPILSYEEGLAISLE